MSDRCTGHCCRAFTLPYPYDVMQARASEIQDGEFIADMIRPLDHGPEWDPTRPGHWYTCRHLDTETGDCRAYEQRPWMCSEYPYGRQCEHPGCTWTNAATETRRDRLRVLSDHEGEPVEVPAELGIGVRP